MGGLDNFDQLIAGAIFRGDGSTLVLVAEIEQIEEVIPTEKTLPPLAGGGSQRLV